MGRVTSGRALAVYAQQGRDMGGRVLAVLSAI